MERVQQRLMRTVAALDAALDAAGVSYAVAGGNTVRAWVAQVDEAAVRTTRDVDILLRRADLAAARQALESAGFVYRHAAGIDRVLDGPDAKARDAVRLVSAAEKVRDDSLEPAPDVTASVELGEFRIVTLEALVRMKLTAFRRKDQMHLLDMIDVELVDGAWPARLPPDLATRLQELLDNPEG